MPPLPKIPRLLLLSSLLVVFHGSKTDGDYLYYNCSNAGTYTINSTFQTNLNLLLSSLSSKTPISGFFSDTKGAEPDQIYGLALCRGDVSFQECSDCVNDAPQDLIQLCPYDKSAIVWYDECYMHYTTKHFFSKVKNSSIDLLRVPDVATEPERFDQQLGKMMNAISQRAAYNSSARMFATGEVNVTSSLKLRGLVQCTRDLSGDRCIQCLRDSLDSLRNCCYADLVGIALGARCILRYDTFDSETATAWDAPPPFSDLIPPSTVPSLRPPSTSAATRGHEKNAARTRVILFPLVVVTIMLACFVCICLRRQKAMKKRHREEINNITRKSSLLFDLPKIKEATNNFSSANKVGEGGFGTVYKGTLSDGQEIAVKRLSKISGQGLEQLRNEVAFIAQLHHKNLVRLLGYCLEEEEQLLVYEYIQNKSLDTFIFDAAKSEQVNWEQRHNIIRGIARGLLYLHQDSRVRIIHRDLKASNILLDASMNPKISDFGLARLFGGDHNQSKTTRVVGTFGYMAPEYAIHGRISLKLDVFSFGVLVLEIVSGRRNNSFYDPGNVMNLLSYAWQCWTNGTVLKLVDPNMGEHYSSHEMLRCINIGLLCAQENPSDRPNMSSVVLMLNRYKMKLQTPSQPAFLYANAMTESYGFVEDAGPCRGKHEQSTSTSTLFSSNEVSITELDPR